MKNELQKNLLGQIQTGVKLKKVVEQKKVISQEEELKLALARAAQGGKPSDIKQDADKLKETPEERINRLLNEIITAEVQLESLSKLTNEDLSKKALEKAELRLEQDNKLKAQAKETLSNYEVALKTLNSTYAALRNDFLGEGYDINEEISEEKLAAKPKHADLLKDVLKKMQEIKTIIGDLKNFVKNDASVSNQKKPIINEKAKLQKELNSKKSEIEKAIRIKNKAEKGSDVSAEYNELYLKAKEARQKKKFVVKKNNLNVGKNASRLDTMLAKVDDHIFECAELKERAKQLLPDVQLAAVTADVSAFEATIAKLQRELQEVRVQLAARHQESSSSTSTSTVETELQKRQANLEKSLRVFDSVEDENAHENLAVLLAKLNEAEDFRLAAQELDNEVRVLRVKNVTLQKELETLRASLTPDFSASVQSNLAYWKYESHQLKKEKEAQADELEKVKKQLSSLRGLLEIDSVQNIERLKVENDQLKAEIEHLQKLKEAEDFRLAAQRLENDARKLKDENTHLLAELERQRQEAAEAAKKVVSTQALEQENVRLSSELTRIRDLAYNNAANNFELNQKKSSLEERLDGLNKTNGQLQAQVRDLENKLSETILSKLIKKVQAARKYASTSLSNSREFLNSSPFVHSVVATGAIVTAANMVFRVLKPEYALLSQYRVYDRSLAQLAIASYAFGSNLFACYNLAGVRNSNEQMAATILAELSAVALNTVAGAALGLSWANTTLIGATTSLAAYAMGTQDRCYGEYKMSISDAVLFAACGLSLVDMLSRLTTGTFGPLSQYGMFAAGIVPMACAAQNFFGKELYNSKTFGDQVLVLTFSALATAATTAVLTYFEKVQPIVTLGASVALVGLSYAREAHSRG